MVYALSLLPVTTLLPLYPGMAPPHSTAVSLEILLVCMLKPEHKINWYL